MRAAMGDSRLSSCQNCSPSGFRSVKARPASDAKNSDRLSNRGCSRTMLDTMVEPQRPVPTMKTGGRIGFVSNTPQPPERMRGIRRASGVAEEAQAGPAGCRQAFALLRRQLLPARRRRERDPARPLEPVLVGEFGPEELDEPRQLGARLAQDIFIAQVHDAGGRQGLQIADAGA